MFIDRRGNDNSRPAANPDPMPFVPGQRWISNAEPELGLGTILRIEGRHLQVLFATAGIIRQYASHSAPLTRAEFRVGQKVSGKGRLFTVEHVEAADGCLQYHGDGQHLAESELDDNQSVSRADERLMSGRVDRADRFDFRFETLSRRAELRRSPAHGLGSARIDLIPHQLRVAEAASLRRPPRVLLADEVGLGKTIEAGMVVAHLLAIGRIARVLVLVPESLAHQWLVELLRRFNLSFSLFDEARCEAITLNDPSRNPFDDEQLVIASIDFLADDTARSRQAIDAGWDLVVVDEAHHLAWSPDSTSHGYALVESLAHAAPGLILLTATPEQLGRDGHFARLRLLDPARFHDLDAYIAESDGYVTLSRLIERMQETGTLDEDDQSLLRRRFPEDEELQALLGHGDRDGIVRALVDRHGIGRVMFRNRRARIGGFPRRIGEIAILDGSQLEDGARQRLVAEFHADLAIRQPGHEIDYAGDPRLAWLLDLIESHAEDKLLLICRSQSKVIALEEALRTRSGIKVARFHEGMTLLQRDRNAAFFADPQGARLLLCSEIGSEGRNFQFARRLVMWDLPIDPDLLEQRIGRLDRIGQQHDIHIHATAFTGTAQHVLLRWYDEAIGAFNGSPADGRELLRRYGRRLVAIADSHARGGEDADIEVEALIGETRATHEESSARVNEGRDRLLEFAAEQDGQSQYLLHTLNAIDRNDPEDYVTRLFEQFGIAIEEMSTGIVLLDPEHLSTDGFPGLSEGPKQATFTRSIALARDDLLFLQLDHPMVAGAMDLLFEGEHGNAAFLVDDSLPPRSALLECIFVLDCLADRKLAVDRYLPPLPIRVVTDSRRQSRTDFRAGADALRKASERVIDFARYKPILAKLVPPMLVHAEALVRERAEAEIEQALTHARRDLMAEQQRLRALAAVNPSVRIEEVDAVVSELAALEKALPEASPRLDAIRFVCSRDFLALR